MTEIQAKYLYYVVVIVISKGPRKGLKMGQVDMINLKYCAKVEVKVNA